MVSYRSIALASSVFFAALSWTYAAPVAASTPTNQTATPTKEAGTTTKTPDAYLLIPSGPQDPLHRPHEELHLRRGLGFLSKGELDSAISELNKALEIDSNSVEARRNIALALLSKHLPVQALEQLNVLVKASKASSYDHQLIGQIYLTQYQNLEAAAAYNEALKLDPSNEYARGGLSTAYAYQGDFPASFKMIQEGLQLSKNNVVWSQYFKRLTEDIIKLRSSPDPDKYVERPPSCIPADDYHRFPGEPAGTPEGG